MAKRNAAVHASTGLLFQAGVRKRVVDLVPIHDADVDGPGLCSLAGRRQEALGVSHATPP